MKNNELITKNIRLVAYRPLELEMLISKEDAYGLDKQLLNDVYSRVKDYPYSYELCTLWAVYKIDNLIEPLFLIEACGLNVNEKLTLNVMQNKTRKIELSSGEVKEALDLLISYIKQSDIKSIIVNKDEEIFALTKDEDCNEATKEYKNNGFKFRLLSAILVPFINFFHILSIYILLFINDYIWVRNRIVRNISNIVGEIVIINLILIAIVIFFLPLVNLLYILIKKKKKNKGLLIGLNILGIVLNLLFVFYIFGIGFF